MVQNIIDAIVNTVTGLLEGLGGGLQVFFADAFTDSVTGNLSALGTFIFVLVGITIALAAIRWVTSLVRHHNR